jgi:osmotically-inducible protein OsmY
MSPEATHRSDTDIFADARRTLDDCPDISATVRVHVDGGMVWLTGTARVMSERLKAERIVREVQGVRDVVNKIVVTTQSPRVEDLEGGDA